MWIAADTHPGRKRPNNQDAFATHAFDRGGFLVVCDGMGGVQGGAVASSVAIETVRTVLTRDLKPDMGELSIRRLLESASAAANVAVLRRARDDDSLKGMGTTMVCAVLTASGAHFAHAGDSRAYLLRDDLLTQLTVDHTVVQMLLDRGDIQAQDAPTHPQRHYITRAVGVEERTRFDIFSIDLEEDDVLLLCTDGLYNYMSHDDLCALTLLSVAERSVQPLIDRANRGGGGDNITAVLASLSGGEA